MTRGFYIFIRTYTSMNSTPLIPNDYLKLKKLIDVYVSDERVVWVERWPNPVERIFNSHIKCLYKSSGKISTIVRSRKLNYFPRISPDNTRLAFLSSRYGKPQIFMLEFTGGEAEQITYLDDGVKFFAWSPDSSKIAFISYTTLNIDPNISKKSDARTEFDLLHKKFEEEEIRAKKSDPRVITRLVYRTGTSYKDEEKNFHIFVFDLRENKVSKVSKGNYHHSEFTWINNSQIISVAKLDEPTDLSMLYSVLRYDVNKESVGEELTTVYNRSIDRYLPGPSSYPGGSILIPMLDEPKLFGKVLKWGLMDGAGNLKIINSELDRNISGIRWINGEEAIVSVDIEGKTELRELQLKDSSFKKIFDHSSSIESFDHYGKEDIYFISTQPMKPSGLWHWDGKEVKLIYDPNEQFLNDKIIIEPREIWLENPEGVKYHGWFFNAGKSDSNKPPLILSIHGGPDFMWNNAGTMWFEWQCSIGRGYSILALNPIGSGGYGEKYADLIRGEWGINDARDLLAAVDSVIMQVDPERLYITGGSYAGFQTVNIISRDNRFKAACAQRGVYNLLTFSFVTDIPTWASHAWNGSVWDEGMLEKLWKHSPVARAPLVDTPLLIIHSENDFRVGISQAEELFAALKLLKKEAVFIRYPRDGHDLSREGEALHIIDRLERMLQWFDDHQ